MDQKPPQLSLVDVKEEAQDVLISDVDGAGHSSPDKKAESTVCPIFNGEVKEETVFQDVTEEKMAESVRLPNPDYTAMEDLKNHEQIHTDEFLASLANQVRLSAMLQAPSASPRPTAATPPGPLNLAILIHPPAAHSVGPSITATSPGPLNPAVHVRAPAAHSAGPSAAEEDSIQDISESQPEMKHRLTLHLLATIKKHRSIYNINKPAFYKRVHKDMLQRDHKFSVEQIRKKISNMLATYKRVRDRCQTTGEARINWDYYTIMDEIFGRSGVGSAPEGTITSTPISIPQPSAPEPDPAVLTKKTATDGDTGWKPASQAASFFDSYEAHAERRTAVLESLVRPDLERFRRLKERRRRCFEKKVLTSLGQISKSLQEIAEGQQEIVKLLQNLQHK